MNQEWAYAIRIRWVLVIFLGSFFGDFSGTLNGVSFNTASLSYVIVNASTAIHGVPITMSNPFAAGTTPIGFVPQFVISGTASSSLTVQQVDFSMSVSANSIYLTPYYDLQHTTPFLRAMATASQGVPNLTLANVAFHSTSAAIGGFMSLSGGTKFQVTEPGEYMFHAVAGFAATPSPGYRACEFFVNSSSTGNYEARQVYPFSGNQSSVQSTFSTTWTFNMLANECITFVVEHGLGATTNTFFAGASERAGLVGKRLINKAIPTGSLTGLLIGSTFGAIGSVNVTQTGNYAGNFSGNFTGTFTGSFLGNYSGTFTGSLNVGAGAQSAFLQYDTGSNTGVSWLRTSYAEYSKAATQVMTSSTWTNLSWSVTDFADQAGNISITSNGAGVPLTRITFASGGIYQVNAVV